MNNKPLVINMFGGPGAGKTTLATNLFGMLKSDGVLCEYVPEFAKELTWEERKVALQDPFYIFGEQEHRLFRLKNKVDIIVTDCPLLLSLFYSKKYNCSNNNYLDKLIIKEFNNYYNLNILVNRKKPFDCRGRNESEEDAKQIDRNLRDWLEDLDLTYMLFDGSRNGADALYSYLKTISLFN